MRDIFITDYVALLYRLSNKFNVILYKTIWYIQSKIPFLKHNIEQNRWINIYFDITKIFDYKIFSNKTHF